MSAQQQRRFASQHGCVSSDAGAHSAALAAGALLGGAWRRRAAGAAALRCCTVGMRLACAWSSELCTRAAAHAHTLRTRVLAAGDRRAVLCCHQQCLPCGTLFCLTEQPSERARHAKGCGWWPRAEPRGRVVCHAVRACACIVCTRACIFCVLACMRLRRLHACSLLCSQPQPACPQAPSENLTLDWCADRLPARLCFESNLGPY